MNPRQHTFQFAGYYAALEKGYYKAAGLDVEIREPEPGLNVVDEVVSKRAQYGVGTSGLILSRHAGKPVVVLAVMFQHSPYMLISRADQTIRSVHDLEGKRLMVEPGADEILAYLKREGISENNLQLLDHTFDVRDFMRGQTDALSAYTINQPFTLNVTGFPYQIFSPRSAGIDFYGDNLFTSEDELRTHSERAKAFRQASIRGWEYALAHPDEISALIHDKYSNRYSMAYLAFQVQKMHDLFQNDVIPIGYMYPGRWRHIADVYAELGMLPRDMPLDGFLFTPNAPDYAFIYPWLFGALALMLGVGGIAGYVYRTNVRLSSSLQALDAANRQLTLFSAAIEHSPASIMIADAHNRIEYVNPHFCAISGYSKKEAIGQPTRITESGMNPPEISQAMRESLTRGEYWSGELINSTKTGEHYWEDVHIAPLRNEQGETTHFVSIKLDISNRKTAEARLIESEELFRSLVESANDIIYTHDLDGVLTYVSPNIRDILGYEAEDIVGRHFDALIHPDDLPEIETFFEQTLQHGSKHTRMKFRALHKDGLWHWHVTNEAPLRDSNGQMIGLIGITRDITEEHAIQERVQHLLEEQQAILDNRIVGIVLAEGRKVVWANRAYQGMLGYTAEELSNMDTKQFYAREADYLSVGAAYADIDLQSVVRHRCEFVCKDGRHIWVDINGTSLHTGAARSVWIFIDATQSKHAEDKMMASESLFRTLYETTSDAIMLLNENRFTDCNRATLALFGCDSVENFRHLNPADLSPTRQPCGTESAQLAKQRIHVALALGSLQFDWMHMRHDNGAVFPAEVRLTAMELNGKRQLQAVVRDVSERTRLLRELEQQARFDFLTGLHNRRHFMKLAGQELHRTQRYGTPLAMLMLDIDHFKHVNDSHGHNAGDRALQVLAKVCQSILREEDIAGRLGGEEFAILLPETQEASAMEVAEKLRRALEESRVIIENPPTEFSFTVSIGVSEWKADATVDDLLQQTDAALYQAKNQGRNRVVCG